MSLETPVDGLSVAPIDVLLRTAADVARPFWTYYDDATGERVELSLSTAENWIAKTANLLRDGLGLESGGEVCLLLPAHWQGAVWAVATWLAGGVVTDDSTCDVVVCSPDRLTEAAAAAAPECVCVPLRPMGLTSASPLPVGVVDYALEVRGYGDTFAGGRLDPAAPAWSQGQTLRTHAGVAEAAGSLVTGRPERRLLETEDLTLPWLLLSTVAPLIDGGTSVLVRNAEAIRREGRRRSEHVTWPPPDAAI